MMWAGAGGQCQRRRRGRRPIQQQSGGGPNYSGAVHVHVDDILEYIQGDTMPVPCDPHEILADRVEGLRLVPG